MDCAPVLQHGSLCLLEHHLADVRLMPGQYGLQVWGCSGMAWGGCLDNVPVNVADRSKTALQAVCGDMLPIIWLRPHVCAASENSE